MTRLLRIEGALQDMGWQREGKLFWFHPRYHPSHTSFGVALNVELNRALFRLSRVDDENKWLRSKLYLSLILGAISAAMNIGMGTLLYLSK